MRVGLTGAVACVLLADPLSAQITRGTVKQATAGLPISGALVELIAADSTPGTGARVASTLSDGNGDFTLRAPSPGRYRLGAKRIGVRRYLSDPFTLGAGETRSFPIELEALEYRLPEIVVAANALCSIEPADRARVASLWEEARTALDAAEISLRDRLFTAQVTRYARELEPGRCACCRKGGARCVVWWGAHHNAATRIALDERLLAGRPRRRGAVLRPRPGGAPERRLPGRSLLSPRDRARVRQGLTGLAFLLPPAATSPTCAARSGSTRAASNYGWSSSPTRVSPMGWTPRPWGASCTLRDSPTVRGSCDGGSCACRSPDARRSR
ncbi:MAG: carboxypeptidase regulatory-like domain-containing protein [Gemmatimonadetes bacterium]|nr:carboxypeptidase regulatory-like domain-containing protein [Gemmatimonadota bacterium]